LKSSTIVDEMSQETDLVLGADDNYAMPLAATICSILKNVHSPNKLRIFILDGGISGKSKDKIKRVFDTHGKEHKIIWIQPDLKALEEISTPGRPPSIYLPVLIPKLLPLDCKKVIYLDCDMIVESDISTLGNVPMNDTPIMAVRDYLIQICSDPEGIADYEELGGSAVSPYFNSGVMILNVELWRTEKWTEKAIQYIQENKKNIYHYDQGVLNALFIEQWGELDAKWNQQGCLFWPQVLKKTVYTEKLMETYEELVHHPCIIHYLSPSKPWNYKCMHPHANRFLYYLKESRWFGAIRWKTWWFRFLFRRYRWLFGDLRKNIRQISPKNLNNG
jgi:lipopolysaccharide biosynthesis glycosyltransferase